MRERLIESRLTPNAISLTGFALNIAAAALVVGRLFVRNIAGKTLRCIQQRVESEASEVPVANTAAS